MGELDRGNPSSSNSSGRGSSRAVVVLRSGAVAGIVRRPVERQALPADMLQR